MDNTPGAPKQPEKPRENPKRIKFELLDLQLLTIDRIDGHSFLTFICRDEFAIVMKKWEYFELQNTIFDIMEGENNVIVEINAECELIEGDLKMEGTSINLSTKEEEQFKKSLKIYSVYNLLSNLSPNIIDIDEHLN